MSEEHVPAAADTTAAPAPEPAAATPPAVDATESVPAPAETTPTPAPAEPAADVPAAPELKPHTDEPGLLQAEGEVKPAEKPAEGEPKPEVTEPAAEPDAYEFKLPDGVEFAPEPLEAFTTFARENQFTPEVAQSLVDMHVGAMQAYDGVVRQAQHDAFGEMRRGWRNEVMSDPELGGAGFRTNQTAAISVLQRFVPVTATRAYAKEDGTLEYREVSPRQELDQALLSTGMADHPAFMRLMLAIHKFIAEPAPVPAPTPPGLAKDQIGSAPGSGNSKLNYTHPRGGRNRGQ
jgi:hypothetical protein